MPSNDAVVYELATAMCETLRRTGQVVTHYHDGEERDLLRRAGHKAGRLMERKIVTHATDESVIVALADWGDENRPLEAHLSDVRARRILDQSMKRPPEQ